VKHSTCQASTRKTFVDAFDHLAKLERDRAMQTPRVSAYVDAHRALPCVPAPQLEPKKEDRCYSLSEAIEAGIVPSDAIAMLAMATEEVGNG
jgi:hypothetical protein